MFYRRRPHIRDKTIFIVVLCGQLKTGHCDAALGAILDATGSFVGPFLVAGSMMAAGGLLGLPARKVARWEQRRNDRRKERVAAI